MKLTGQPATARPHEPSLHAYEAFLKGRHRQHGLFPKTAEERGAGIEEYFKQAIALDPQWAEPHSALGQQYFLLWSIGLGPSEMIPIGRAEAWKALELLPSEPMAHAVLGAIAAVHDYDWKEADEQFELARASESVSPSVHHMYTGFYLSPLGRFEEALQLAEKVITQDPLNMLFRSRQLLILFFRRNV